LPASDAATAALWRSEFDVDAGSEYDVFGMYFHRGTLWVYVIDPFDRLRPAPLALFTIVDGAIPTTWKVSQERSTGAVFLASPEASKLSFAARVDELEPTAVNSFNRMLAELRGSSR
jgi:hypothetical protein